MGAAVQRWRLVLTHVFPKTFFFSCAVGLVFFFASCSGCVFHRFHIFVCSGCVFHRFFMHGTPAAYAEQGERSAALSVEKGRELELRVTHSCDVELMASFVKKLNLRVAGSRAGSAVLKK